MNNTLPSGLTFTNHEEVIERVAVCKAHEHKKIGYYDFEDIKQEVRIKCWAVINRWDADKGANLYVFLSKCAENRLRDIKRSVLYKHNKPCLRCPFWNKLASTSGAHDCRVYDKKTDCEKYAKHEQYVHMKMSASQPMDIDTQRIEDNTFDSFKKQTEMMEFIESKLPEHLVDIFQLYKKHRFNAKVLKPKQKSLLISTLKRILNMSDFN